MFDTIDRIVNLDLGKRGVDKLYEPARAVRRGVDRGCSSQHCQVGSWRSRGSFDGFAGPTVGFNDDWRD